MLAIWLVVACLFCAIQAIRATHMLMAALWLAGVSTTLAIILYVIGAYEIAVIELSVGTGLVTVLLVFAVTITGEAAADIRALVPRPLAWGLIGLAVLALGWMSLPWLDLRLPVESDSFMSVLWRQRGIDVLVQIVLMFAGALGVLGLLADERSPATTGAWPTMAALRAFYAVAEPPPGVDVDATHVHEPEEATV